MVESATTIREPAASPLEGARDTARRDMQIVSLDSRSPNEPRSDDGQALGAFEAWLGMARVDLGQVIRKGGIDRASPKQMFEADPSNAHTRRMADLKQEFRSAFSGESGARGKNGAGVEVRPSGGLSHSDRAGAARGFGLQPGTGNSNGPPSASAEARLAAAESPGADGRRSEQGRIGTSKINAFSRIQEGGARAGSNSQADLAAARMYGDATAAARVRGGASGDARTAMARQIGQVLGAARSGSADSARAVNVSAATVDSRSATNQPRQTAQTKLTPENRADPGADRAGKGDGVTRTPFDELVRTIRLQTGKRYSSARMTLDPPRLGKMKVDVQMSGDRVRIDVRAETAEATKLLLDRTARLKSALESQGFIVDRLEVTTNFTDLPAHSATRADRQDVDSSRRDRGFLSAQPEAPGDDSAVESAESPATGGLSGSTRVALGRLDIRV